MFKNQEWLRWILLTVVAMYASEPYILGFHQSMGGPDAFFYHSITADVMQQNKEGIFPIYIGQSLFNFSGLHMGRAPYYLMLVSFLNYLTFFQLTSLEIQHLTLIVTLFAAIYLMYLTLVKVAPPSRWSAVALASFYILCPGILGLIHGFDMYFAIMTIPYIPLLFYAVIRIYQKNDIFAYLLFVCSLSLLWMAHPPIAVWTTLTCALIFVFMLMFRPRLLFGLVLASILFLVLNLWHFTTVFSAGLGGSYLGGDKSPYFTFATSNNYASVILPILRSVIPGVFLPVDLNAGLACLQLGYSLWALLFIGFITAIKGRDRMHGFLLSGVVFLSVLLYPFPYVTFYLWTLCPSFLQSMTILWPMERLYVPLAGLASCVGALALRQIYFRLDKVSRIIVNVLLLLAVLWSMYQAYPLIKWGDSKRMTEKSPASWLLPENARFQYGLSTDSYRNSRLQNIYDPAFENRLLDSSGQGVPRFDNTQLMEEACLKSRRGVANANKLASAVTFPAQFSLQKNPPDFLPLMNFTIFPGIKYLLCFDMSVLKGGGFFEAKGDKHSTLSMFDVNSSSTFLIPLFTSENYEKNIKISLFARGEKGGSMKLHAFRLMPYDAMNLPIRLYSLIPYHARVNNPLKSAYLETARSFTPGYKAWVNGKLREVMASPRGNVMIPLSQGVQDVLLEYPGTVVMQRAFYISAFAWGGSIVYLLMLFWRKNKKIN